MMLAMAAECHSMSLAEQQDMLHPPLVTSTEDSFFYIGGPDRYLHAHWVHEITSGDVNAEQLSKDQAGLFEM